MDRRLDTLVCVSITITKPALVGVPLGDCPVAAMDYAVRQQSLAKIWNYWSLHVRLSALAVVHTFHCLGLRQNLVLESVDHALAISYRLLLLGTASETLTGARLMCLSQLS